MTIRWNSGKARLGLSIAQQSAGWVGKNDAPVGFLHVAIAAETFMNHAAKERTLTT
jgi:hypothetical protein